MKKLFAFSKLDNSFIVSAPDENELQERLDEIKNRYDRFYKEYVVPGVTLIKAKTLGDARKLI